MAFIYDDSNNVVSFAEPQDVYDKDQRLFDANESLTDAVTDVSLQRATERILRKLQGTLWWKSLDSASGVPAEVDPNLILTRHQDFTDLCVFTALADYILPGVADFGDPESAEREKMNYYTLRADELFVELSTSGDWYDADDSGTIEDGEYNPSTYTLKRVR